MNREIKFRAWHKKQGLMLTVIAIDWEAKFIGFEECIDEWDKVVEGCYEPNDACNLDGVVLMQYTGLKDKNGKEIWEGDIIKKQAYTYNGEEYDLIGIVECVKTGFYLKCIKSNNEACLGQHYSFSIYTDNEISQKELVIGNVFENPELLE